MSRLDCKPILLNAQLAHRRQVVQFDNDGVAHLFLGGEHIIVEKANQYDLTQATIFGLNERLTMSAHSPVINGEMTLRDCFNEEWAMYAEKLEASDGSAIDYGYYAYYPARNHLVRYCDPFWHRVVATASTSMLFSDPTGSLSWKEVREVLSSTVIGVAGCSVGSNVIHATAMDLRPVHMKVADKSVYKLENINRVKVSYWDIVKSRAEQTGILDLALKSKARAVADQLYAIDPFMFVHVYDNGLHEKNIPHFFDGVNGEPPIDIIVEEIDDPKMKLILREEARKRKLPLLMVTDAGSSIQLDVMRYDIDDGIGLAHGISDTKLKAATNAVYDDPGNREVFFQFVDSLIGPWYRQGELLNILNGDCEIPTSTIIPQMGSTATMAGGVVAEAIARIRLGYWYPPRMMFNKHTFEVTIMK